MRSVLAGDRKNQGIKFSSKDINSVILFGKWAGAEYKRNDLVFFAQVALDDLSLARGGSRKLWKRISILNNNNSFSNITLILKKKKEGKLKFYKMFLFGDDTTGLVHNL